MADSICWSKETTVQENQHFIQIRFEERLKELTQLASWITGKPGYKDHQDFFLDQVKINNALEKFQRSLIKYCPQKTFFDPVVPEETDCD
jgi:hypothetical protein